jgi:hypothetical protein
VGIAIPDDTLPELGQIADRDGSDEHVIADPTVDRSVPDVCRVSAI